MTTTATRFLATLAALLMALPAAIGWLTESKTERVQRRARDGWSRKAIATREGITLHRVRKALAA